jgi:hypothetical protein
MWPFVSAWKSRNEVKALQAVEKESNPATLAKIIKNAPLHTARLAAAEKLDDRDILFDTVKWLSHYQLIRERVDKTNKSEDGKDSIPLALKMLEKLKDEEQLAQIAKYSDYAEVSVAAIGKLTHQELLAELAYDMRRGYEANHLAAEKVTDQELLADLAYGHFGVIGGNSKVREDAISRLKNHQTILAEIAKEETDFWLYRAAIDKLDDKDLLIDVAKNADETTIARSMAVERLNKLGFSVDMDKLKDIKVKRIDYDKESYMPLKCPQCNKTIMIVGIADTNMVYKNFDENESGRCPFCRYKYMSD